MPSLISANFSSSKLIPSTCFSVTVTSTVVVFPLASNVIKGGLDAAIQITMDRPEAGSLGGAPLEEAKSWAKARCGSSLASVVGDVTVIFPLIYAAALDKMDSD